MPIPIFLCPSYYTSGPTAIVLVMFCGFRKKRKELDHNIVVKNYWFLSAQVKAVAELVFQ